MTAPTNAHVVLIDVVDDELVVECHACGEALEVTPSGLPFDVLREMVVEHLGECVPPDLTDLQADLDEMERTDPDVAAAAQRVDNAVRAITAQRTRAGR